MRDESLEIERAREGERVTFCKGGDERAFGDVRKGGIGEAKPKRRQQPQRVVAVQAVLSCQGLARHVAARVR